MTTQQLLIDAERVAETALESLWAAQKAIARLVDIVEDIAGDARYHARPASPSGPNEPSERATTDDPEGRRDAPLDADQLALMRFPPRSELSELPSLERLVIDAVETSQALCWLVMQWVRIFGQQPKEWDVESYGENVVVILTMAKNAESPPAFMLSEENTAIFCVGYLWLWDSENWSGTMEIPDE